MHFKLLLLCAAINGKSSLEQFKKCVFSLSVPVRHLLVIC